MPTIRVVKPFVLQLDPREIGKGKNDKGEEIPVYGEAERVPFRPGTYEVTDEVANHWYTKCHLEGYVDPEPQQGTQQYAHARLLAEQASRMGEPVADQAQRPAPQPEAMAPRMGEVPDGAHYFAGGPQESKELPEPPKSTVSFLPDSPPQAPRETHHTRHKGSTKGG